MTKDIRSIGTQVSSLVESDVLRHALFGSDVGVGRQARTARRMLCSVRLCTVSSSCESFLRPIDTTSRPIQRTCIGASQGCFMRTVEKKPLQPTVPTRIQSHTQRSDDRPRELRNTVLDQRQCNRNLRQQCQDNLSFSDDKAACSFGQQGYFICPRATLITRTLVISNTNIQDPLRFSTIFRERSHPSDCS